MKRPGRLMPLLLVWSVLLWAGAACAANTMEDYCVTPPFLGTAVPPNILMVLDNSGSMNEQAYAGSFDPDQFVSGHYYGYFDPTANYRYDGGQWEVTTDPLSTASVDNPIASGNLLNWATMRRIDVAKKLLIGGKAVPRSPSSGITVKLYGEESPSPLWDYSNDHDSTAEPELISPFRGNYRYRMTEEGLFLLPHSVSSSMTLRPRDNASAPASWGVSGVSSAWSAVDEESADGDSTTLRNTSDTEPVLFDYRYTGAGAAPITSVTVKAVAKKSDRRQTMRLQAVLQVNGMAYASAAQDLDVRYDVYTFTFEQNPQTGEPWQWKDIKAADTGDLEAFGIKAFTSPSSSNSPVVTQLYLEVSADAPSGGPYKVEIDQGKIKAEGLIDSLTDSARFGLAIYNEESDGDGGHIETYVDFGAPTNMVVNIHGIGPSTWSPLAETLFEMVRYYRQDAPFYSDKNYTVDEKYDPYHYKYSKLSKSTAFDQKIRCAKSFVLMLTDGEGTMDTNIPSEYRDYDKDSNDGTIGSNSSTNYFDDVALWARTVDHRSDLEGEQNIFVYPVYMFGRGSQLLKEAAINGGFQDLNGDDLPGPSRAEYQRDSDGDGTLTAADLPLTYFEGNDGYELEKSLTEAISAILGRAASGTAVSLLSTSSRGVGSMVQAYYQSARQEGMREVAWTGYTQNFWVDDQDNLREDSVNDLKLKPAEDRVLKHFFDAESHETKVALFTTDASGEGGTLGACGDDPESGATIEVKPFDGVVPLWEAGEKLALTDPDDRTLFTSDRVVGSAGTILIGDTDFTVLNVSGDLDLQDALDPDATYPASSIVRYIRGEALEATDPNYRDRRVTVNGNLRVWKLGDIVGSSPTMTSNMPANTYHYDYGDVSYLKYVVSDAYRKRSSIAFAGANDGVLHAFRVGYLQDDALSDADKSSGVKALFHNLFPTAATHNTDELGKEVWGFIPFNAFPYLKYLADPDYCHLYYNDLNLRLIDASLGGDANPLPTDVRTVSSWKTLLLGGMRFGGSCDGGTPSPPSGVGDTGYSAYYALDVTDPENPEPLWEFSDDDLGYASTYPSVFRTGERDKNGRWYVVVGSGSKQLPRGLTDVSRKSTGYLFILDLETGALVKKIELGHNAMVADVLSIDAEKDYEVERLYFGTSHNSGTDWAGKLMSLKIPSDVSTLCGAGVTRTYAQCTGGAEPALTTLFDDAYPFTSSPDAVKDERGNLWVYAGSGKYYSDIDEADSSAQIFFGLKDADATVLKDEMDDRTATTTTGTVTGTTQACLYDESAGAFALQDMVTVIELDPLAPQPGPSAKGWYLNLTGGERVISRPLAIGGLVDFLSYRPSSDPCASGGETYLYSVDYVRGTAPSGVAIRDPGVTDGATSGKVTVNKKVRLGPGAPPSGEAIMITPPKEGKDERKKKIQISSGVVVEAVNKPTMDVKTQIIHWLNK